MNRKREKLHARFRSNASLKALSVKIDETIENLIDVELHTLAMSPSEFMWRIQTLLLNKLYLGKFSLSTATNT